MASSLGLRRAWLVQPGRIRARHPLLLPASSHIRDVSFRKASWLASSPSLPADPRCPLGGTAGTTGLLRNSQLLTECPHLQRCVPWYLQRARSFSHSCVAPSGSFASPSQASLSSDDAEDPSVAAEDASSDENTPPVSTRLTPVMRQYWEAKREYPGYLLFFRLGDFFEMFYDDAINASRLLGITLTKRDKKSPIPMAGVPAHAVDVYLRRLIQQGVKVAICDQVETAEEARSQRRIVRREVVRLVTPGTLIEEQFLPPGEYNYLCTILPRDEYISPSLSSATKITLSLSGEVALSWVDISTGSLRYSTTTWDQLDSELARIAPSELLLPDTLVRRLKNEPDRYSRLAQYSLTVLDEATCSPDRCKDLLSSSVDNLSELSSQWESFSDAELVACGNLLNYVAATQNGRLPKLSLPIRFSALNRMHIDPTTRRSLEMTSTLRGDRAGSLLSVLDRTVTATGARLLRSRMDSPSLSLSEIEARLDCIQWFRDQPNSLVKQFRELLRGSYDVDRCLQRLSLGKGSARELTSIAATLEIAHELLKRLRRHPLLSPALERELGHIDADTEMVKLLSAALVDSPPPTIADGGFIRSGYDTQLEELRELNRGAKKRIAELQAQYRESTGIPTLKIRRNTIFGYFIEVSASHVEKLSDEFSICRNLKNASRYKTAVLNDLESRVNSAHNEAIQLEKEIFEDLTLTLLKRSAKIRETSHALASLDVAASLAVVARENGYVRPLLDDSCDLEVVRGRHAVVEAIQNRDDKRASDFVENDCALLCSTQEQLWLLTGPNMSGKSTFLRANAIITILAQMGSFVPASSARIGLVDSILSRVGATDDLARNRSTFMTEMMETAMILHNATPRSLVILDEIGRGTSTSDGLAIATSVLEYLHDQLGCRCLFSTHYHELPEESHRLPSMKCVTSQVQETAKGIAFLHRIVPGRSTNSYGIHCAELAGLPSSVIARARQLLQEQGTREDPCD